MEIPYREIVLPSLVNDVREIFWDHIVPYGVPKTSQLLRSIKIDPDNAKHQAMIDITVKYPFLENHLLMFIIPAGQSTLLHIDGLDDKNNRKHSCNIPISGCSEHGITEFYQADPNDFFSDTVRVTRFIKPKSNTTKIGEYALIDNLMLCDTQTPHRVSNINGSETRVSVSWTTKQGWSWDMIANYVATNY